MSSQNEMKLRPWGVSVFDNSHIGKPSFTQIEKRNSCHGPEGVICQIPGISDAVQSAANEICRIYNEKIYNPTINR